jgi:uncharacterized protein (TIGR03382 family)
MKSVLVAAVAASLAGVAQAQTFVNWASFGDGSGPVLVGGGISVTATAVGGGSGLVNWTSTPVLAGATGLGVRGGGSDFSLDRDGEVLDFAFPGLVTGVRFGIWDVDPPGNVEFSFEAFQGGSSIGTFAVPALSSNPEIRDFTALAGGQAFSRVRIFITSTPAPIGILITSTEYIPAPGALALLGVAGIAAARRRR